MQKDLDDIEKVLNNVIQLDAVGVCHSSMSVSLALKLTQALKE